MALPAVLAAAGPAIFGGLFGKKKKPMQNVGDAILSGALQGLSGGISSRIHGAIAGRSAGLEQSGLSYMMQAGQNEFAQQQQARELTAYASEGNAVRDSQLTALEFGRELERERSQRDLQMQLALQENQARLATAQALTLDHNSYMTWLRQQEWLRQNTGVRGAFRDFKKTATTEGSWLNSLLYPGDDSAWWNRNMFDWFK